MKKNSKKNDEFITDSGIVEKKDTTGGVVIGICIAVIAFLVFLAVCAIANI